MGPPPTNFRQGIRRSLLETGGEPGLFHRRFVVQLSPTPGASALDYARALLAQAGFNDLAELRTLDGLPRGRLICREVPGECAPTGTPIFQAAILGLCNAAFYSFNRPIVWTEARLLRQVELFSVDGFYDD